VLPQKAEVKPLGGDYWLINGVRHRYMKETAILYPDPSIIETPEEVSIRLETSMERVKDTVDEMNLQQIKKIVREIGNEFSFRVLWEMWACFTHGRLTIS